VTNVTSLLQGQLAACCTPGFPSHERLDATATATALIDALPAAVSRRFGRQRSKCKASHQIGRA